MLSERFASLAMSNAALRLSSTVMSRRRPLSAAGTSCAVSVFVSVMLRGATSL
jgi:hypothetical protein